MRNSCLRFCPLTFLFIYLGHPVTALLPKMSISPEPVNVLAYVAKQTASAIVSKFLG